MNVVAALMVSLIFPLGFVLCIRGLDLYGTGKLRNNIYAMAWGLIAYTIAFIIQAIFVMNGWITQAQLVSVLAPISEEILKAGILLYLVSRADFNYVVDGAIYGFGAGIGFAIIENGFYVLTTHEPVVALAFSRVFSANLIHASASGLIGSALAAGRIERGAKRWGYAVIGFMLAIGIHMGFNNMVTINTWTPPAIAAGSLNVGLIAVIIKTSLDIERGWIIEKLGMTDRVTRGEAAIVQRIQNLDDVLDPIAQRFGPEKAALTASLLYLQAEIGIKRKLIEMTADANQRALIEEDVWQKKAEMDALRKKIGSYCMLFVRSVYLVGGTQLWELIDQRVGEAGSGAAGGGLWSKLDERIKSSKSRDEDS